MSRILFFTMLGILLLQSCIQHDTITYQAQLKMDTESIDHFIENNKIAAVKVSTGFWYSIDNLTNGVYPALSDSVTISYKLKWIKSSNSTVVDLDTLGHSISSKMLLSTAISGLQQALILFPDSSVGRIYLPSGLAFGASGHFHQNHDTTYVNIPPNANLLYEIKLIRVKGTRLASDIATIDSYLQSQPKPIVALHDDSGIRYTLDTTAQTSHQKPQSTDSITVTYNEVKLSPDSLITLVNKQPPIALKDQITAWRIMLPKYLTEGSTITMYVPSGYAYGAFGKPRVPANTNMSYEITLTKIN